MIKTVAVFGAGPFILAEMAAPTDPTGGWITVVAQLGAVGILAIFLLFIYPREAKSQREERLAVLERFDRLLNLAYQNFRDGNREIVTAIGQQTVSLNTSQKDAAEKLALVTRETAVSVSASLTAICKGQQHSKP